MIFHPPSVNALQKTLDAQLLAAATASMTLNNVTSIVNGPGVVVIDRVDANGDSTASKREYIGFTGVSGSTLTGLTRNIDGGGSDQDHAVGAIVEFIFDVVQGKEIKDIVETEHSTAGGHTTDVIAELTPAAGVTVDGILLKDDLDTSGIVGKTTTQTLTNKTLTSPTINGATISGTIAYGDNAPNIAPKARAYLSGTQSNLVSGIWTKVLLDTEDYDVGGDFASNKFTAPVSGYYLVVGGVTFTEVVGLKRYGVAIWKNGAQITVANPHSALDTTFGASLSTIIHLDATNYVELYALSLAGVDTVDIISGSTQTFMAVHLISV